jgi:hypothetical protein
MTGPTAADRPDPGNAIDGDPAAVAGRRCTVPGCDGRHQARGYCHTHYMRWQRHGDPRVAAPVGRRTLGGVSYWSVHERVKTERGPATAQRCAECAKPAVAWSYDGTDPDERTDPARGYHYSLDLHRYRPRCRSCHRRSTIHGPTGGGLDVERAARLYRAGASSRGIGALLQASPSAVLSALRANGVEIRRPGRRRR